MSRKKSREIVYRMLYSYSFTGGACADLIDVACADDTVPTGVELKYIENLFDLAVKNLDAIDGVIKEKCKDFNRIFKTDLAALRLGVAEIKHTDTPPMVIIDSVVEIAKKYGNDKSGGFINGVLACVI